MTEEKAEVFSRLQKWVINRRWSQISSGYTPIDSEVERASKPGLVWVKLEWVNVLGMRWTLEKVAESHVAALGELLDVLETLEK